MKLSVFHSATLRLTAWYTLLLVMLGLLFSVILFQISAQELAHSFRPPRPNESAIFSSQEQNENQFQTWRELRIAEGRSHLVGELLLFNLIVVSVGAMGSYFLARYTLRPVEAALESQTRFSSDAAHELRTPLTIMQSEIEVGLRDRKATKQSHAELLQSSLDEVQHLRTLTDRLLMLANNHEVALGPASLEAVAIDAVNRSIPLAQTKKISIENEVADVQVIGNPESLTDALNILLENAIKYSPAKSAINVSSAIKGKHVLLQVSDNGPGITEKDLPHIFERFYRADTSRSNQNVVGHGLGLSIAKQIVDAHHGTISAANNTDKGATFTLILPLSH